MKDKISLAGDLGSGKSTVAKALAARMGIVYVDTGALYRTVGYAAIRAGIATKDAAALEAMPFPLTVWRAYDVDPDPGISWTLDREWCEGYARSKGRRVKQMQVSRDQVFAYVSRRGEEEVIVL